MADVRKTVEIALQVVGVDLKKITQVADAFTAVQKQIEKTTEYVSKLQKSLDAVKAPKSLSQVIENLKQLDKIKAPNLTNIANGFDKLGKMAQPPDISAFVKELQKFQNIKLPGVTTLVSGFKKLTELPVQQIISKITALNSALAELDKKGGISAFKNFARDVNQMKTAFSGAEKSMSKMKNIMQETGNAAQQSGLKLRTFGDKVKTVLQFRVISEALMAVNDSIRNGLTAILEYDQALKDLQAITGATSLEVAQMGAKILEVASTTKFSASEVAQGMRTIGQAGFSATEAVETMQAVSDLATGTLSDMSTTVDLVTTAMRVFQIDATQSADVADVFANAVNRSKLTVDKLRIAMNYVGPIANSAGVSFKELAASMGTLANSGLRASTIGTGLRRVFAALLDPSKKLKEAARAAGVSLSELDPRSTSLSQVISNLGLVVNDAQVAFDVFGKRGAAAVLSLSGAGSKFQEMLGTIGESGAAAKQAAIQMEGLGVSFKNLQDKIGILAIALGDLGVAQAMKFIIDVSRQLIDILTALVSTTFVSFIGKIIIVTGLVTALGAAFLLLSSRVLLASKAIAVGAVASFKALASAISATTVTVLGLEIALAPILGIVAAIAAVGAGMWLIFKDGAREASESAAILAEQYNTLEKKLRDYGLTTINMKEGSDELAEANINLRNQLLEVSKGSTAVAESARLAAESIDPLTGSFNDGKEALKAYNNELNQFQTDELVKALEEAGKSLDIQTSNINRWVNRWKDAFIQVGIYASAGVATLRDILNFDVGEIPGRWADAWKKATARSEEIKQGVDFSKALDNGTKSVEDLKNVIKTFDMKNLTTQQAQLVESYNALNERAIKFAQHQRDIGAISLRDTLENIQQLAADTGLTGLELQAVVLEFKRLKEANEDTFSNIIEKWEKDADPKFLTSLIDGFKELGGVVDEAAESDLKQIENQRALRIQQLADLKATVQTAKESGRNMEEFWGEYYQKEQEILKQANEDRKFLSESATAQQLIAYDNELSELEKHLAKIRETWKYNAEERGKQIAKAKAESEARLASIISDGPDSDPKEQTKAYKLNLKEREAAHAQYIASIAELEAGRRITEEQAEKQRIRGTLDFYKESYVKALEYQDLVSKEKDPDEYAKRSKLVLDAEKKFFEARTTYLEDFTKLNDELEGAKADRTASTSKAVYDSIVDTQREATKTVEKELKASYDQDLLSTAEYYAKKRDIASDDIDKRKEDIQNRVAQVKDEYAKLISASNSLAEQEGIRADQAKDVIDLETELNLLEQERRQTLSDLTAAEYKQIEAQTKKQDKILEDIRKSKESSELDDPYISFEDKFAIELEQLKRSQQDKYQALEEAGANELQLAQALADQQIEIANTVANHEKELNMVRLDRASEFTGNMASIAKDLYDSGLIQGKEAFKAYQALAIAEATVNTYKAATGAYSSLASIPYVGPVLGAAAAAAAIAAGIAQVAQIRAQSFADGGEIQGYSPHPRADNIDIKATAGEYVQPVSAVQKYGSRVMNAIRSLSIPADALKGLISGTSWGLQSPIPSFALADGGPVVSEGVRKAKADSPITIKESTPQQQAPNIVNVLDPTMFQQYTASQPGQRSILNVMGENIFEIKQMLSQ